MTEQSAQNAAPRARAMAVIPVPAPDYWRLVDQASAFADLEETAQFIEEVLQDRMDDPEAQREAWEAFSLACNHALARKWPMFGQWIATAAQEQDKAARERLAYLRRSDFRVIK